MLGKKKNKSKKGALKKVAIVIVVIFALLIAFPVAMCRSYPGEEAKAENITNPYITKKNALVSAHRSGKDIAPENTMAAFKHCIESEDFNVDIYEFDLHITKDGKLILLHDDTLDRTTNSVKHFGEEGVKPSEKTYEELRELNFGENFQNTDGKYPYESLRGDEIPDELRAVLLEDVLDYLESNGDFRYIIEIKDSGENGKKACDELYRILKEKELLENVVFGTDVANYCVVLGNCIVGRHINGFAVCNCSVGNCLKLGGFGEGISFNSDACFFKVSLYLIVLQKRVGFIGAVNNAYCIAFCKV